MVLTTSRSSRLEETLLVDEDEDATGWSSTADSPVVICAASSKGSMLPATELCSCSVEDGSMMVRVTDLVKSCVRRSFQQIPNVKQIDAPLFTIDFQLLRMNIAAASQGSTRKQDKTTEGACSLLCFPLTPSTTKLPCARPFPLKIKCDCSF